MRCVAQRRKNDRDWVDLTRCDLTAHRSCDLLAGRNRWLTNGLSVICSVINLFTGALLTITIYTHGPASIAFGQWPAPLASFLSLIY